MQYRFIHATNFHYVAHKESHRHRKLCWSTYHIVSSNFHLSSHQRRMAKSTSTMSRVDFGYWKTHRKLYFQAVQKKHNICSQVSLKRTIKPSLRIEIYQSSLWHAMINWWLYQSFPIYAANAQTQAQFNNLMACLFKLYLTNMGSTL